MPASRIVLPGQKTVLFEVCVDLFLQTDGSSNYVWIEREVPEIESPDLGLLLQQVFFTTVTHNRTTNVIWTIGWLGSNTGRNWTTPPVPLFTDIAVNGEAPTAPHTTAATFAYRHSKLVVGCKNATGSARENVLVSAWGAADLRS